MKDIEMKDIDIKVKKKGKGRFQITCKDFPETELYLDFNPIVNAFALSSGTLIHWQGRPKSEEGKRGRRWGFYDIEKDTYFTSIAENVPDFKYLGMVRLLDIDEAIFGEVPVAVVYFPQSTVRSANGLIFLS